MQKQESPRSSYPVYDEVEAQPLGLIVCPDYCFVGCQDSRGRVLLSLWWHQATRNSLWQWLDPVVSGSKSMALILTVPTPAWPDSYSLSDHGSGSVSKYWLLISPQRAYFKEHYRYPSIVLHFYNASQTTIPTLKGLEVFLQEHSGFVCGLKTAVVPMLALIMTSWVTLTKSLHLPVWRFPHLVN